MAGGGIPSARPPVASQADPCALPTPLSNWHPQESGEKWTAASEVQLCYEIKTFLLAGHETSAAMLCWSLFELSQSPEALQKVRWGTWGGWAGGRAGGGVSR